MRFGVTTDIIYLGHQVDIRPKVVAPSETNRMR
jgi:hypothetical protein